MRTVIYFVSMTIVASQASAQSLADIVPNRYVTFPIDPGDVALLKNRLQNEKQLASLRDLVKQIAADPTKSQLDPAKLKDLKLDDSQLKTLIQDLTAHDPHLQKALRDWIKQDLDGKQPQSVEQLQKKLQSILEQPSPKLTGKLEYSPTKPPPAANGAPIASREDPLAKFTENAMNQVKDMPIGDLLRDSPAWKSAFASMQNAMKNRGATSTNLGRWSEKLLLPNVQALQLNEKMLQRIRNMPRPKMDRWRSNLTWSAIRLIPPSRPTGPDIPNFEGRDATSLGAAVSWLLVVTLVMLVGWQLLRSAKRTPLMKDDRAELGPWPTRPETVTTRTELIQAFNYLALLTLGKGVRSWNHQAVASCWSERSCSCAPVAATLANLYEQARYTHGAETLSDAQRDLARQSLVSLTEIL